MNYELAKQLKEAGFPQDKLETGYCIDELDKPVLANKCGSYDTCGVNAEGEKAFICKVSTLSELIDACGDRFKELEGGTDMDGKLTWFAFAEGEGRKICDSCKTILGENDVSGCGKTPEEAVAKLWLKLHA